MTFENKRLIGIMTAVTILLLIPLLAMKFSDEFKWTAVDFITAGVLLFGTGLACELVMRKVKTARYRIVICAVILAALFLVWAELAVGIFGTRFAGS